MEDKIIETRVQLHYRYGWWMAISFCLLLVLFYFFATLVNANQLFKLLFCIGVFICCMIILAYLVRKLTKKIRFSFSENFEMQISDIMTNSISEAYKYNYTEIKSCQLSSSTAATATFKLNFTNNESIKFVLYAGKEVVENEDRVAFGIFEELNKRNAEIMPDKPFFVGVFGTVWIIAIIILLLIDIVLKVSNSLSSAFFMSSLPSAIGLIALVVGTRIKQKKLYDEMIGIAFKKTLATPQHS